MQPSSRECPRCHKQIKADALVCPLCKSGGIKQAAAAQVTAARRRVKKMPLGGVEFDDLPECPPVMIDEAPDGGGLGAWVLVDSDDETCTYEYGGGIA